MHLMEPVELRGDLVSIEPLRVEHAAGLLAAADSEEIFTWLPYPRPADFRQAQAWIDGALSDRESRRRFPFAVPEAEAGSVIGSTSYWDFDAHNAHVEIGSTWLSRASRGSGRNVEGQAAASDSRVRGVGIGARRLSRGHPQPALPAGDRAARSDQGGSASP